MKKGHLLKVIVTLLIPTFLPRPATALPAPLTMTTTSPCLSEHSRAILYILYVTKRIAPSIQFMEKNVTSGLAQQCAQEVAAFFTNTSIFKTEIIQNTVTHIKLSNSLQPLFYIWKHIQAFRYGVYTQDKDLILDFAKLYLIAYQALLFKTNRDDAYAPRKITPNQLEGLSQLEQIFEEIEESTLSYCLKETIPYGYTRPQKNIESTLSEELSAAFAYRFYLNQRLFKTFKIFTFLHNNHFPLFAQGITRLGFNEEDLTFTNRVIHSYFETARHTKNFTPVAQLISQFRSFDFIKSSVFIKEFLIFLCIAYKDIYSTVETTHKDRTFIPFITELHQLSVEQLLTLLDRVTEKITVLISMHTTTISQPSYVEKWLPSVGLIIASAGITYAASRATQLPEVLSIPELIQKEHGTNADTFTNLVFSRYYFVQRLKDVVKALLILSKQHPPYKTPLPLKPLSVVWQDFISYKELNNVELIEDFSKEIFILSSHFLHTGATGPHTHVLHSFVTKQGQFISEHTNPEQPTLEQLGIFNDLTPDVEINNVILRFYHVKRLEPVMAFLEKLAQKSILQTPPLSPFFSLNPSFHAFQFEQKPILKMITSLEKSGSYEPLFAMWHALRRYKYIHDDKVFKEFTKFITQVLHTTLTFKSPRYFLHKSVLSLEQLHTMSLEDILNLLDILVEELPAFLENNELNEKSTLTWKEWLKKYWLVAPISTLIFALKLYLLYKDSPKKPPKLPAYYPQPFESAPQFTPREPLRPLVN